MTFENIKWSWINGRFVPWSESTTPIATHALHYGTGVFEGIRSYESEGEPIIFRLDDHLKRFYQSAATYDLEISYSQAQLAEATAELLHRNGLNNAYIRPLAYMGTESLGIRAQCPTEVAIIAWPNMVHISEESKNRGLKLTVSPVRKFHSSMFPTTAKASGQYLNSRSATMKAIRRGYDEALLLDMNGNVAEAAVANVFIVENGVIKTNDERSSILMGITRDSVLQIAASLGYKTEITILRVEDLQKADEVFLTGTACEILPIAQLDDVSIGNTWPGPITQKIKQVFDRAKIGLCPEWEHWLYRAGKSNVAAGPEGQCERPINNFSQRELSTNDL